MRRNAPRLLAAVLVVSSLTGCSLFQKKDASLQTADSSADIYSQPATDPAYVEPSATTYDDPYARSYTPLTSTGSSYDASSGGSRYHTVAKRDTLYSLARNYYSDQRRWKDIYEANRDLLADPNRIYVGQRLLIP